MQIIMSKTVQILGTGCPKCKSVTNIVQEVVAEHKLDINIEKVEDIMEIMKYNVMSTPALVLDKQVLVKGRVPSKDEVLNLLS